MSRRNVSPMRGRLGSDLTGPDERDLILKKLKEELISARGKEKEILILDNHLADLLEKNKLIS